MKRTYNEVQKLESFGERFDYLFLGGEIGMDTFGHSRHLNQLLYRSPEWRRTRDQVIIRDNGCDLGVPGFEIHDKICVHHITPITIDDVKHNRPTLYDLDNLICMSFATHNAIHFGNEEYAPPKLVVRTPGDTTPWA
jgi:hypothetical protein